MLTNIQNDQIFSIFSAMMTENVKIWNSFSQILTISHIFQPCLSQSMVSSSKALLLNPSHQSSKSPLPHHPPPWSKNHQKPKKKKLRSLQPLALRQPQCLDQGRGAGVRLRSGNCIPAADHRRSARLPRRAPLSCGGRPPTAQASAGR